MKNIIYSDPEKRIHAEECGCNACSMYRIQFNNKPLKNRNHETTIITNTIKQIFKFFR